MGKMKQTQTSDETTEKLINLANPCARGSFRNIKPFVYLHLTA